MTGKNFGRCARRREHKVLAEWSLINRALRARRSAVQQQRQFLENDLGLAHATQLAAADVFVEKAQIHLTSRAHNYYWAGAASAACAIIVIVLAFRFIGQNPPSATIAELEKIRASPGEGDHYPWYVLLFFIRTVTIGGLATATLYLFVSLSRAFFHEGTVLFARRHSIRLGRLYMYAKYGILKNEDVTIEKLIESTGKELLEADNLPLLLDSIGRPEAANSEKLEEAFGWNLEIHTAFKDIKADKMSSNLFGKMLDTIADLGKSIAAVRK